MFRKPPYQYLTVTGSNTARALPDIGMQVGGCPGGIAVLPCNGGNNPLDGSGNSDRSYVIVAIQGNYYGLIGTSVSSPELAGATAFHRGIPGYNGVVTNNVPGRNYNYTTGNGTPIVYHYVAAPLATPAGLPQTASNP